MALEKVSSVDVNYQTSAREVGLYNGDVSQLSAGEDFDALAIVVQTGKYSVETSDILKQLLIMGLDVSTQVARAEFDYRTDRGMGVWVTPLLKNLPFTRLVVLEADNVEDMCHKMPYLFAGIEKALGAAGTVNTCFSLPDCFPADTDVRSVRDLFYQCVHWGAINSVFFKTGILVPSIKSALNETFTECVGFYNGIDALDFDSYATYAGQAKQVTQRVLSSGIKTPLTERQIFGLAMYTTDFAFALNRFIRIGDFTSTDYIKAQPIIEAIDTALMNLAPPFGAVVYRAEGVLSDSRRQDNQPGKEVVNTAYTSTTWNQTLPFLHSMPDYPTTFSFAPVYTKDQYDARFFRLVEDYSYHPEEDEVLAIRDMKYKVDFAFDEPGDSFNRYIIIGTEVPMPRR